MEKCLLARPRAFRSRAKVFYGDIYALPEQLGPFDIVILGAILEHLSDPIRALSSESRVAGSMIVINTDVLETEDRIARFDGDASRPDFDYVFWTYSLGTYRHVLRMLGFETIRYTQLPPQSTGRHPSSHRNRSAADRRIRYAVRLGFRPDLWVRQVLGFRVRLVRSGRYYQVLTKEAKGCFVS